MTAPYPDMDSRWFSKSLFNLISSPFSNKLALKSSGVRASTTFSAQTRNTENCSLGTSRKDQTKAGSSDQTKTHLITHSLPTPL